MLAEPADNNSKQVAELLLTRDLRSRIETPEWQTRVSLGKFRGSIWFLRLDHPPGFPIPTQCSKNRRVGSPLHVTLGRGDAAAIRFLTHALQPEGASFSFKLRKWSWRPEKTAYRVVGGTLCQLLRGCAIAGFAPGGRDDFDCAGEWHVTL